MDRIYHPYSKWEDYKAGFYNNCSGSEKQDKINKAVEMFCSARLTRENMFFVVDNWKYSCEQNLTNPAINKIAYIGQAACCVYANIPNTITMEAWSLVPEKFQDQANEIAKEALDRWTTKNQNMQLCLNID